MGNWDEIANGTADCAQSETADTEEGIDRGLQMNVNLEHVPEVAYPYLNGDNV